MICCKFRLLRHNYSYRSVRFDARNLKCFLIFRILQLHIDKLSKDELTIIALPSSLSALAKSLSEISRALIFLSSLKKFTTVSAPSKSIHVSHISRLRSPQFVIVCISLTMY